MVSVNLFAYSSPADAIFAWAGASLVKLGRAHCKVATLQEAFALTFKDTFLASIERFKEEIKEYEVLRKKLDSRRSVCVDNVGERKFTGGLIG